MDDVKLTEKDCFYLANNDFRSLSRKRLTSNQWDAFYNGMKRDWYPYYPHWRNTETTYLWFTRDARRIRSKWSLPLYTEYSFRNVCARDFDSDPIYYRLDCTYADLDMHMNSYKYAYSNSMRFEKKSLVSSTDHYQTSHYKHWANPDRFDEDFPYFPTCSH